MCLAAAVAGQAFTVPFKTKPDNAVEFFNALPRRIDDVTHSLSDEHDGTVKEAVMSMVDEINMLIHQIEGANYRLDVELDEAAEADHLEGELAPLIRSACTEAARGIAGVGQWNEPDTHHLLASIDRTGDNLNAELGRLRGRSTGAT